MLLDWMPFLKRYYLRNSPNISSGYHQRLKPNKCTIPLRKDYLGVPTLNEWEKFPTTRAENKVCWHLAQNQVPDNCCDSWNVRERSSWGLMNLQVFPCCSYKPKAPVQQIRKSSLIRQTHLPTPDSPISENAQGQAELSASPLHTPCKERARAARFTATPQEFLQPLPAASAWVTHLPVPRAERCAVTSRAAPRREGNTGRRGKEGGEGRRGVTSRGGTQRDKINTSGYITSMFRMTTHFPLV